MHNYAESDDCLDQGVQVLLDLIAKATENSKMYEERQSVTRQLIEEQNKRMGQLTQLVVQETKAIEMKKQTTPMDQHRNKLDHPNKEIEVLRESHHKLDNIYKLVEVSRRLELSIVKNLAAEQLRWGGSILPTAKAYPELINVLSKVELSFSSPTSSLIVSLSLCGSGGCHGDDDNNDDIDLLHDDDDDDDDDDDHRNDYITVPLLDSLGSLIANFSNSINVLVDDDIKSAETHQFQDQELQHLLDRIQTCLSQHLLLHSNEERIVLSDLIAFIRMRYHQYLRTGRLRDLEDAPLHPFPHTKRYTCHCTTSEEDILYPRKKLRIE